MKRLIITAIFCGLTGIACAKVGSNNLSNNYPVTNQIKATAAALTGTDTVPAEKKSAFRIEINRHRRNRPSADSLNRVKHSGFKFNFDPLSNFSLGLANLIDNGSFNLSPKNQFLNYTALKTSYVGFDIIHFGYRFNNYFKINLGAGFDWTLIRLQNDSISIVADKPTLTFKNDGIAYRKNRFSSNYFVLPLSFDFRSDYDKSRTRFHLEAGPEVGFLVDGMLKQISAEHGKVKNFNNFHFSRFEYGAFTRIGYGDFGIFAKYFFNDMFVNSPDQKGLKSFSFGLTVDFD